MFWQRWKGLRWAGLALAAGVLAACGGGGGGGDGGGGLPPGTGQGLTVTVTAGGTVTSQPAGIDCGTRCSADFATDATVTLTARAQPGFDFTGWGGACSGTAATCTVTMSQARTASASFRAVAGNDNVVLGVTVTGNGAVRSQPAGIDCGATCSASYARNTAVTLMATPATGQALQAWGGACSGQAATCSVTMDAAKTVTAAFAALPPVSFALDVAVTGSGSVRSQPAGIDCGSSCRANFTASTAVVLTATPAQGQLLQAWGGACSGQAATCNVTMDAARAVTATFAAAPAPVLGWGTAALLENSNDFNVAGTNIFADADVLSAIDAAGNALVLWEQSDGTPDGSTRKVFSRRYVAGQGWAPAVVVPGFSSASSSFELVNGSLLIDAAGNATWVRDDFQTRRYSPATGWSATAFVPAGVNGGQVDAAIDSAGNVHVLSYGGGGLRHARLPAGSSTWSAWAEVAAGGPATARAQLALGAQGSVIAVWRERNPGDSNFSMKANRTVGGTWQAPVRIEEVLTNVNDHRPALATDGAGNAIAAWTQGSSLYVARFDATAGTWAAAQEVDAGQVTANNTARVQVAMAADGRAVLAWNSATFGVKSMRYDTAAGFAAPVALTSYSSDHVLAIDRDGRAQFVYRSVSQWPNPTDGTQNLYARELPWGGAWSAPALLETGAGDVKGNPVCAMNDSGAAVCAWAQDDLANDTIRNSLWANLRR